VTVTDLICIAIQLYLLIVLVRILMSWVPPTPGTTYAQVFEVFDRLTEPVLAPIRAVLPPFRMGVMALDLSPIVVMLIGILLQRAICG
jgi:YggT family protein